MKTETRYHSNIKPQSSFLVLIHVADKGKVDLCPGVPDTNPVYAEMCAEKRNDISKIFYNYESGKYENIDRDGFSYIQGTYAYYWDNSEYQEEERRREDEHQQNGY